MFPNAVAHGERRGAAAGLSAMRGGRRIFPMRNMALEPVLDGTKRLAECLFEMDGQQDGRQERAAVRAHAILADSAGKLSESAEQQTDSADRRTELAADRTVLAAERTYAAWVRTGLAALASGVGSRALLEKLIPNWLIGATGSLLILFSGFCFVAAVWRQMSRFAPPKPETRRIPAWMLIGVNGFLLLVSLAALVGIWVR